MAYRRSYRRNARKRTPRRSTRRVARRTRTRITRRPRTMSRKRVLNISSRKKQDNMLPYATNPDGSGGVPASFGVPGNNGGCFVWCATARDRSSNLGDPTATSVRETDVIYARGLKERIRLTSNSARSWRWRRICFTAKGVEQLFGTPPVSIE